MSTYDDLMTLLSELLERHGTGGDYIRQYLDAPQTPALRQRIHQLEREIAWVGFWHHFLEVQDDFARIMVQEWQTKEYGEATFK